MERFEKGLAAVMRFLMALAMAALVCGGTWQIFSRWILGNPSTFTDEFLRYVLIWASMIGSAYCFYRDEHLALDLVTDRVNGKAKTILTVFIEIMIIFFVVYVFVLGGSQLVMNATNASSVMRIPFRHLHSVLPISGVFSVVVRVLKSVRYFTEKKGGSQ